jgi:hypothetical protein
LFDSDSFTDISICIFVALPQVQNDGAQGAGEEEEEEEEVLIRSRKRIKRE